MRDFDSFKLLVDQLFPDGKLKKVQPMKGCVSATVLLLEIELSKKIFTKIVLRSPTSDHSNLNIDQEFELLKKLQLTDIPVPKIISNNVLFSTDNKKYIGMEFVQGIDGPSSELSQANLQEMAVILSKIHSQDISQFTSLPKRINPLEELFTFMPKGYEWKELKKYLKGLKDVSFQGNKTLLHGDFWPQNLIWQKDSIIAVLDWEDASIGDPMSDLAVSCLELRYKNGRNGMYEFIQKYSNYHKINNYRLKLWLIYVSAAAQYFMGDWRLTKETEDLMRKESILTLKEIGENLILNENKGVRYEI